LILKNITALFVFLLVAHLLLAQKKFEMEEIRTYAAHQDEVTYAVFSKDGSTFASGGSEGTVLLWSTASGQIIQKFEGHPSKVNYIAFSNDGTKLAAAFGYGTVYVWDIASGAVLRKTPYLVNAHTTSTAMNFVVFSPDDSHIYFGGETAYLCRAPVDSNNYPVKVAQYRSDALGYAEATPQGNLLAYSVGDELRFMDMESEQIVKTKIFPGKKLTAFDFSSDGSKIAMWFEGGEIEVVNSSDYSIISRIKSGGGNRWAESNIVFSPGDSLFMIGSDRHSFDVWYTKTGKLKCQNDKHYGIVVAFDFHPNGKWVLSGSADKKIKLWKFKQVEAEEEEQPDTNRRVAEKVQIAAQQAPLESMDSKHEGQVKGVTVKNAELELPKEPTKPIVFQLPKTINGRMVQEYRPPQPLEFTNARI